MRYYIPNPACGCGRCATRGLMGPAVLITLGLLFLLSNVSDWPFHRTWPVLLIVIGLVNVVRYVVSDETHLNPGQYPPPPPPYGYGPVPPPPNAGPGAPVANETPASGASAAAPAASASASFPDLPTGHTPAEGEAGEVNHG